MTIRIHCRKARNRPAGERAAKANGRKSAVRRMSCKSSPARRAVCGQRPAGAERPAPRRRTRARPRPAGWPGCAGYAAGLRPHEPAGSATDPNPVLTARRKGRKQPESSHPDVQNGRNGRKAKPVGPLNRPNRAIEQLGEASRSLQRVSSRNFFSSASAGGTTRPGASGRATRPFPISRTSPQSEVRSALSFTSISQKE